MCGFYEIWYYVNGYSEKVLADHIQLGVGCNKNIYPPGYPFGM